VAGQAHVPRSAVEYARRVNDRAGKSMRFHVLPADSVVGVLRMLGTVEVAGS
jgi:hypothetical protein